MERGKTKKEKKKKIDVNRSNFPLTATEVSPAINSIISSRRQQLPGINLDNCSHNWLASFFPFFLFFFFFPPFFKVDTTLHVSLTINRRASRDPRLSKSLFSRNLLVPISFLPDGLPSLSLSLSSWIEKNATRFSSLSSKFHLGIVLIRSVA